MSSSEKERITYSLKGPIPVQGMDRGSESGIGHLGGASLGKSPTTAQVLAQNTGTAVLDLSFQYPCQIGELSFRNYYTAWLSILIKKMGPSPSSTKVNNLNPSPMKRDNEISPTGKYFPSRPHLEPTFSTLAIGGNGQDPTGHILSLEESSGPDEISCPSRYRAADVSGRRPSTWTETDELERRPWETALEAKSLMSWPHFEAGAQDRNSILATECLVDLRNVALVRFVLHQPSTVWKRFTIEDLNVFKHLTKRGNLNTDLQMDPPLLTLQRNTRAVLWGQIVEPENNVSEDDDDDELTS